MIRKIAVGALCALGLLLGGCDETEEQLDPTRGSIAGKLTFGSAVGSKLYAGPSQPLAPIVPEVLQAVREQGPSHRVRTTRDGKVPFIPGDVLVRTDEPNLSPDEVLHRVRLDGLEVRYAVNVMPRGHLLKVARDGQPLGLEETR
ncbi:MAG: hypothetical protein ACK4N5_04110, partial [Myxococcales bacterium]